MLCCLLISEENITLVNEGLLSKWILLTLLFSVSGLCSVLTVISILCEYFFRVYACKCKNNIWISICTLSTWNAVNQYCHYPWAELSRRFPIVFSNSRIQKALGKYEWISNGWFEFIFHSFMLKIDSSWLFFVERDLLNIIVFYTVVGGITVIWMNCHLSNVQLERKCLYPSGKRKTESWCHPCCLVTGFFFLSFRAIFISSE